MKKRFHSLWFQLLFVGTVLIFVHKIINDGNGISLFFKRLYQVFRPFFLGGLIALLLNKPCSFFQERFLAHQNPWISRHSTGLGVLAVYGAVVLAVWFSMQIMLPAIYFNLESLIRNFPDYYERAVAFSEENQYLASLKLSEKLMPFLEQLFSAEALSRYVGYLSRFASSLIGVLTAFVVSVYMLLEKKTLLCVGKRLVSFVVKKSHQNTVFTNLKRIGNLFYFYFTGLGLDALFVGTLSVLLFWIFGVPYAFLFGVFSGFCNLIPFFGPIVAAVVIFSLSFLSVGFGKAVWILVLQIMLGQIDANIIQPKIVSHSVGISPFWVIFAVLVFGELWGITGMILGVPIVAVARVWFFELEEARYR